MKNNTVENSKVIEERIGKTVFFVGTKHSDDAKRSLEDKLKNLMIILMTIHYI